MALLNWIKPDTYLMVDEINYIKKDKILSFTVILFNNSSKQEVLLRQNFTVRDEQDSLIHDIEDFITLYPNIVKTNSSAPPDVSNKDYILNIPGSEPVLLQLSNSSQTVYHEGSVYDGTNYDTLSKHYEWTWVESKLPLNRLYRHSTNGLFKYNTNTSNFDGISEPINVWNTYFSIESMSMDQNNIIKQCYLYLKSLSLFEGLLDV